MKFSIIIPLYNKAKYIEKALLSVLNQTYKEFEVIVVDDGSTDDGAEKVKKFMITPKSPKGDLLAPPSGGWGVIAQKNSGVSIARNNGVKAAKYDYIAFLDADDWWEPTFLEEMKALIEEFPNAGIYGSSYFYVKNGKNIPANIGVEKGFEKGMINYFQVYAKTMWMPLTSISIVIHKKIFEKENGFNSQLKLGEDFDLWVKVALKYPVVFLNKQLSYYNQDVEQENRAIGMKLYKPQEHMLFTDYGMLMKNLDFKYLFEKLALYGLLPYYLNNVNKKEVNRILYNIDWKKHGKKYRLHYKRIPRQVLKWYFDLKKVGFRIKKTIKIWITLSTEISGHKIHTKFKNT